MYKIIKNVIENGSYVLSDMLVKIDTCWLKDHITEDEKNELAELARTNADPIFELNTVQKLKELENRIKVLEGNAGTSANPEEYPEYQAGKWYYKDDAITFKSKKYICTVPDGQVCTWNPEEYPSYWSEVTV